jgi:hypothetical protein
VGDVLPSLEGVFGDRLAENSLANRGPFVDAALLKLSSCKPSPIIHTRRYEISGGNDKGKSLKGQPWGVKGIPGNCWHDLPGLQDEECKECRRPPRFEVWKLLFVPGK